MLWLYRHSRAETVFALTKMRAMAIAAVGFAVMLQQRHAVQATLAHDAFETVAVVHFRERANDLLSCIHTIIAPRTSRCSTKQGWHTRRRLGQHCHRPAHTSRAEALRDSPPSLLPCHVHGTWRMRRPASPTSWHPTRIMTTAPVSQGHGVRATAPASALDTAPREASSISYAALMGTPARIEPSIAPIQSAESIRAWVRDVIYKPSPERTYRIREPPADRPVRIYADGVYDLFHYAHALQLRQAKLSFPNVHLIVGVVSSGLCEQHKNRPLLESAERYEAVRNCRWVDEVVEDAPWVIDDNFMNKLQIDYVAHDELPYAMATNDDVYDWIKKNGQFLPTRRTEGVSTSDLVARIVSLYRGGELDAKLTKMGEEALTTSSPM